MPVRLLQRLSVDERGFSFQDRRSLAIGTSKEDSLCNEMSRDGVIVPQYFIIMMSYVTFLQALRHNFGNLRERKRNRPFTRPIFPVSWAEPNPREKFFCEGWAPPNYFSRVAKNGLGTRLMKEPYVTYYTVAQKIVCCIQSSSAIIESVDSIRRDS